MMKNIQDNTLVTRETTIGHWQFKENLESAVGAHTLLGRSNFSVITDYINGYTENGITAIECDGAINKGVYLPAVDATAFDFGAAIDFSIEVIVRVLSTNSNICALVYKWDGASSNGIRMGLSADGKLRVQIGDGTDTNAYTGSVVIADDLWHHLTMVVDRTNDKIYTYIDGVVDIDGSDISDVAGALNPTAKDFEIGYSTYESVSIIGMIDEVCISTEVLTATCLLDRATGKLKLTSSRVDGFLLQYLPTIHHNNDALKLFLIPFCETFLDLKMVIDDLDNLVTYDRVPESLLPHLASNVGIELPDGLILDEYHRRLMVKNAIWLYKRKGTLVGVQGLVVLLGFSVAVTEYFDILIAFKLNLHRAYSRTKLTVNALYDAFTNTLTLWNIQKCAADVINIIGGQLEYLGGTPSAGEANVLNFDDASDQFYVSMDFDEQAGSTSEFGFMLSYTDDDNYVYVILKYATGHWYLTLGKRVGGSNTTFLTVNDVETIFTSDLSAQHKLWCYADCRTLSVSLFSIGIDDMCIIAEQTGDLSGITLATKGIYNAESSHFKFDNFKLEVYTDGQGEVLLDPAMSNRAITVTLTGTPDNATERKNFLKKVLPNYVPVGIEITVAP